LSAYLAGIGYAERSIPDPVSADALLEVDEGAEPIAGDPALRAFESWIPNAELRELLNALSKGSPLMPSDLWRLPISEFLFNLRVRLGNELLTATLPRLRRMTAERPQGPGKVLPFRPPTLRVIDVRDPLAAIGIERG
jgi:hypothetical protein